MRKGILFILMACGLTAMGQSKKEKAILERTYLLSQTVFGTKDSAILEELFAREATYGHSGGKVETREEAIAAISKNRSVYTDTSIGDIQLILKDGVALVRYHFQATETNRENKVTKLNFNILLVWVKEKRSWKLMGRQAVKLS